MDVVGTMLLVVEELTKMGLAAEKEEEDLHVPHLMQWRHYFNSS